MFIPKYKFILLYYLTICLPLTYYFRIVLKQLSISNYAIIDALEVEFASGMNVITGETGAGKSILLGALSLVLGERADSKVLLDQQKKCVIEAQFSVDNAMLPEINGEEFDIDATIILRREIAVTGKSRSFINDTPATLQQLKHVGELLVNMHSQHETLDLIERGFQMNVLDTYAGLKEEVKLFREDFFAYKKELKALEELRANAQRNAQEEDYLQFQLNEFTQANLTAGEQEVLEQEQQSLANVEDIKVGLDKAIHILDAGEVSMSSLMSEALAALKPIAGFHTDVQSQYERLIAAAEELRDIKKEIEHLSDNAESNPERLEEINQRLHVIFKLQKRHGVTTIEELMKLQESFEQKLALVSDSNGAIEALERSTTKQFHALLKKANAIHTSREQRIKEASAIVQQLLQQVGMPSATFSIALNLLNENAINENGLTDISFLFSANKGFAPKPLKDMASGGELSRLMLCIKTLLANADHTPTMIFDEIDTGISGEVALRVGDIMGDLAKKHQLICITHLPQIARCGDAHYFVYKENSGARTNTNIKLLSKAERETEIAKMIGGEQYSDAALKHAKELIKG